LSSSVTEEQTVKTHRQNHLTTSYSLEVDRVKVVEALNSLRKKPFAAFSLFKELKERGFLTMFIHKFPLLESCVVGVWIGNWILYCWNLLGKGEVWILKLWIFF
jgi:hypothetical protein